MNVRVIALNTFGGFLRDRLIILFCALFASVVLLMMTPLLFARSMGAAGSTQQTQTMVLGAVSGIMFMASGFGSLLAAWAATDTIASEMRSGTILAVMARHTSPCATSKETPASAGIVCPAPKALRHVAEPNGRSGQCAPHAP